MQKPSPEYSILPSFWSHRVSQYFGISTTGNDGAIYECNLPNIFCVPTHHTPTRPKNVFPIFIRLFFVFLILQFCVRVQTFFWTLSIGFMSFALSELSQKLTVTLSVASVQEATSPRISRTMAHLYLLIASASNCVLTDFQLITYVPVSFYNFVKPQQSDFSICLSILFHVAL